MSKRVVIKSNYQLIRLWFEFYKLALTDNRLFTNLEKTKKYYQPWGDITDIKFDDWYKSHSHLFLLKISEITRVSKNKNVLSVSIPLSQTVTESLRLSSKSPEGMPEGERLRPDDAQRTRSKCPTRRSPLRSLEGHFASGLGACMGSERAESYFCRCRFYQPHVIL